MSFRNSALSVLIILSTLFFVSGCSEREEPIVAPGSTEKADDALEEAAERLTAAGVSLSFDEPGDLLHPEDLIPEPEDLADTGKQANFEEAIAQLNTALAELEQQSGSNVLGSISDRALVHLQLGFIYTFDAVSRLLLSDDPKETFVIKRDLDDPDNPWYTFGVSPAVEAELDATGDSREYPLVFTVEERQAIIDAADLMDDAVVKPLEPNIQPQHSSVNRQPYTGSAIGHFQKAANLFGQYKPEIMDSIDELNESLEEMRVMLQKQAEGWGFIYIPPVR
ncbi:hypothetical protein ACFL6S_17245 [Candidatus Poribacteria bacterium]